MSAPPRRIVCIGSRLHPEDAAGPLVHDRLRGMDLPSDLEVIDGGLGGIDLLARIEGAQRVVFVDAVEGFAHPGTVVSLPPDELAAAAPEVFDHAAGLPYLLRIAPVVLEGTVPEMRVLGLEGPPSPALVAEAAARSLELSESGRPPAPRVVG